MTKQKSLLKNCIKGFLSLAVLGLFAVITSCNNDDDNTPAVTHKIVYKAEASAGTNITSAGYLDTPGGAVVFSQGVFGTTWVSPETIKTLGVPKGSTVKQSAYAQVKATGVNASSTLKVQIYVDGVLTKEVTGKGEDLKVEAREEVNFVTN